MIHYFWGHGGYKDMHLFTVGPPRFKAVCGRTVGAINAADPYGSHFGYIPCYQCLFNLNPAYTFGRDYSKHYLLIQTAALLYFKLNWSPLAIHAGSIYITTRNKHYWDRASIDVFVPIEDVISPR